MPQTIAPTPPPRRSPPPPPTGMPTAPPPVARVVRPLERRESLVVGGVFNAVEGFGKTTFAAHAPSPMILMAEQGYQTLLDAGRVPQVPAAAVTDWRDAIGWVDSLIENRQGVQTLFLDALGGFERMCQEYICAAEFGNDWGERGFGSFQKGYELSAGEWLKLLARLDRLRTNGVSTWILGHVNVTTFKNPEGADYDQFTAACHRKTWDATAKWADVILFGNFYSDVQKTSKQPNAKGKVIHTNTRVIYTERGGAVIAKNRYGMQPQITLADDPALNWPTVWEQIVGKPQQ